MPLRTVLKLAPAKSSAKAAGGCRSSSTEFEPAVVDKQIVKIRTFAIGLEGRPSVSLWPWLLTAIWGKETSGRKTNYGFYRNKVSNNLGAAPGTGQRERLWR